LDNLASNCGLEENYCGNVKESNFINKSVGVKNEDKTDIYDEE